MFDIRNSIWIYLPILLIISIPLVILIAKQLTKIWIYMFCKEPHLYDLLTPIDQVFTCFPCVVLISMFIKLDSVIEINQFRDHFYQTFLAEKVKDKFPVFRCKLITLLGFAYRKPIPVEELDLTYHIREVHCGLGESEKEFLQNVQEDVSRINSSDIPNWEIVLVQFPHENRTTIIIKMDHWLVDGVSVRLIVDTLTGNETVYQIPEAGKPLTWRRKLELIGKAPYGLWLFIKDYNQANWHINPWFGEVLEKCVPPPKDEIGKHYQSCCTLDLQKLKQVSKLSMFKMQAVFISLHVSTMRKLLKKLGKFHEEVVLEHGPIQFPAPAPSHPAIFQHKFCNCLKVEFVYAPLQVTDRLQQLKITHERIKEHEDCEGGLIFSCILNLLAPLLPHKVFTFTVNRILNKNLHYTTINPVVFSPNPYHLLGAKVTSFYCIALFNPLRKIALGGILLTPITVGNVVEVSVRGPATIFESQLEADMYLSIYSEELDMLLRVLKKQDRG